MNPTDPVNIFYVNMYRTLNRIVVDLIGDFNWIYIKFMMLFVDPKFAL